MHDWHEYEDWKQITANLTVAEGQLFAFDALLERLRLRISAASWIVGTLAVCAFCLLLPMLLYMVRSASAAAPMPATVPVVLGNTPPSAANGFNPANGVNAANAVSGTSPAYATAANPGSNPNRGRNLQNGHNLAAAANSPAANLQPASNMTVATATLASNAVALNPAIAEQIARQQNAAPAWFDWLPALLLLCLFAIASTLVYLHRLRELRADVALSRAAQERARRLVMNRDLLNGEASKWLSPRST